MRDVKSYIFAAAVTAAFALITGLTQGFHGIFHNGVALLALYFGSLAYAIATENRDELHCQCTCCKRLREAEEQQKGMNL